MLQPLNGCMPRFPPMRSGSPAVSTAASQQMRNGRSERVTEGYQTQAQVAARPGGAEPPLHLQPPPALGERLVADAPPAAPEVQERPLEDAEFCELLRVALAEAQAEAQPAPMMACPASAAGAPEAEGPQANAAENSENNSLHLQGCGTVAQSSEDLEFCELLRAALAESQVPEVP